IRDRNVTGVQTCALPISLSVVAISNFETFNPATLNMQVGEIRMFKAASAVGSPWGSASSWVGFIVLVQSGYWKYEALSSVDGDRSEERRVGKGWREVRWW